MNYFTGLLDQYCDKIYEGESLQVGMRRDDSNGWTIHVVARAKRKWFSRKPTEWILVDEQTGEKMQMQHDQELRRRDYL